MEEKVKEAHALFLQGKHSPAVALYTAAIESGGSATPALHWYPVHTFMDFVNRGCKLTNLAVK
jgi:hypothetical protein